MAKVNGGIDPDEELENLAKFAAKFPITKEYPGEGYIQDQVFGDHRNEPPEGDPRVEATMDYAALLRAAFDYPDIGPFWHNELNIHFSVPYRICSTSVVDTKSIIYTNNDNPNPVRQYIVELDTNRNYLLICQPGDLWHLVCENGEGNGAMVNIILGDDLWYHVIPVISNITFIAKTGLPEFDEPGNELRDTISFYCVLGEDLMSFFEEVCFEDDGDDVEMGFIALDNINLHFFPGETRGFEIMNSQPVGVNYRAIRINVNVHPILNEEEIEVD